MKLKRLAGLALLMLAMMVSFSSAQACEPVNSQSLDYGRREDGRCEGIRRTPISGSVRLVSLVIRGSSSLGDDLLLEVPTTTAGGQPSVRLQTYNTNYLLDRIPWSLNGQYFSYRLNTRILRRSQTSISSLRARAYDDFGLSFPVRVGGRGTGYEIVFLAQRPTRFSRLAIEGRNDNRVYYETSLNVFEDGEIRFTWDGKDRRGNPAAAGDYVIKYSVATEQRNGPPLDDDNNHPFRHHPAWLQ